MDFVIQDRKKKISENWENKHFHEEPKNPKLKGIKTKIKSKPIQKKISVKSNISYPNLKKNGEKRTRADSDNLMCQIYSLIVLMRTDFSFSVVAILVL